MKHIGLFVVGILISLFNGLAIKVLWGWFMTIEPISLPPIGVIHAIGLALLVSVFTSHAPSNLTEVSETPANDLVVFGYSYSFCLSAICLLSGWIVHFFL